MAKRVVDETRLTAVADAIRERAGTSEPLVFPDGFVSAVGPLVNAEDYLAAVQNKTITEIVNHKIVGSIPTAWQQNNKTLTKIDLSLITLVSYAAFSGCSSLAEVNLPAVEELSAEAFQSAKFSKLHFPNLVTLNSGGWIFANCIYLERVYFQKEINLTNAIFYNCYRLKTLVLGSDSICTLATTKVFEQTPIAGRTGNTNGEMGYIYVPSALVDSYKTATNWSAYASQFRAIEDYPEVLEGWE